MKKRFLLTSVLMLLLTLFAVSTSTYAWFTMSTTNTVDEFTVTAASASGGLAISADGQSFSETNISIANPANLAYDLAADKDGKLYSLNDESEGTLTLLNDNTKYNEFFLYFGTSSWGDISINLNHSYMVPFAHKDLVATEAAAGSASKTWKTSAEFVTAAVGREHEEGYAFQNQSTEGDVERDWIAAAFRMSFQVVGYQTSTSSTWGTGTACDTQGIHFFDALRTARLTQNKTTRKYTVEVAQTGDKDNNDAVLTGDAPKLVNAEGNPSYVYTCDELLSDKEVVIAKIYDNTVEGYEEGYIPWVQDQYTIVKVKVTMWIEGQDKEAKLPLTAGKIAAGLEFKLGGTYANPTDFRTVINFTNAKVNSDGFTWNIPAAALAENVMIFESTTQLDKAGVKGLVNVAEPTTFADAADKTATTLGKATVETNYYYLVAKVNVSDSKASGYKVAEATSFTIGAEGDLGDAGTYVFVEASR